MGRWNIFSACVAMAFPLIAIEYNGEDVTSKTQTIIVGQKANLSVKIKNSILFPSRYLWSIPGVIFKNFDGTKQSDPYSPITFFDFGNENIAFYWTDGEHLNNSNINNSCVRCIVFIGAQSFTGQTTFNIQRPYVTVYCNLYLSYTIATFNNGDKGLYFGNNDINVPGINLSGAYLGAINGSFCWVQVLNKSYSMINKGTNGIKYEDIDDARDGEFPYKSGLNMNDSPQMLLHF